MMAGTRGSWFGASPRGLAAAATVELGLVAALAQDRLDRLVLDRLARAVTELPELAGVDWDWIVERARELAGEAPLFFDTRERLVRSLSGTPYASPALAFARALLGGGAVEDASVILSDVAARLGVEPPPDGGALPGLDRARFDDPDDPSEVPFHVALERADAAERRLLLHKLRLARGCLDALGEGARVVELGRRIPVGHRLFRADAVIEGAAGRYTCRLLAPHEALHPAEHALVGVLAEELALGERLLVGHAGALAAPDAALLDGIAPDALLRLDLGP